MDTGIVDETFSGKFKYFLTSLKNSNWALTASEKAIDSLFSSALELEDIIDEGQKSCAKEFVCKNFLSLHKPLELLLHNIVKNPNLDDNLVLYAFEKYILFQSKGDFLKLLDKILSEIELRKRVFQLIEEFPDVDLDLYRLNNFLNDVLNSHDIQLKVLNGLRSQTLVFLKAIKYSEIFSRQVLINEMITCLESQTDLKLWFTILKEDNLETVLDLVVMDSSFFNAILKFFDKFADEIESNYDEELTVQYSHVNLDFEDFVKLFQLLLNENSIKNRMNEYLGSKTLTDKNFCFWVDVKSCL